ncbi:collagen alpha-1(XIV) chain-like [Saccostrea echinata]|uniref:collagen alpha-1(XIV) chain-like n=1 Tax=Saccostrea echinata TaxID=191078 RepID=UPI002A83B81D|nr:collagen alpha-1(XIV) chain-like [Saccostrea echinata]XP_061194461.1 collagen alpha-1(XIV) chain-like [Saccostrea echinata]
MIAIRIAFLLFWMAVVCGQGQEFDLSQFDFSGVNFNANQPSSGPTQAPVGLAFSNQASGNSFPPSPMMASQGKQQQNQPMFSNPQQQGNQLAFPTQNQNQPPQTQFSQTSIQSSRVNSLTPEESWLTVGGSQMQNRNPGLTGPMVNGLSPNSNGQSGFPNQNGFAQRGTQGGFLNRGPPGPGFTNQGPRLPPNRGPGGGFEQFGTPGNDMLTFNVNAMGQGPSDFSAFSNNPFAGTPFGDGLNIDQNQFGNPNLGNPNTRIPNMNTIGRPQVTIVDAANLPPSVQMAMNMNGRPVGGFMGPVPGGLPGLGSFTGFQPPILTSPIQQQSRGGFGGLLSRLFG